MASETGSRPPASGATPDAAQSVPVEAEIVDAEFVEEPPSLDADGKAEEPRTAKPGEPPKRRAPSPGLMLFVAFVIVAAGVFIAFTLSRFGAREAAPDVQQAEEGAPAVETPQAEAASPALPKADPSKIVNSDLEAAKEAAALDPSQMPQSSRGLPPPPPPGSANDDLQRAAKEAARIFGPDNGDAIDEGPQTPAAEPQIQFETEGGPAGERQGAAAIIPPAGAAAAAAEAGASNAEIAALKENFDRELAQRDARANAEVAALRAEIERLQQGNPHASDAREPTAILALAVLDRAVDRGEPFTEELDNFARLAPGAPPIERLRPMAATGAPVLAVLKEEFDAAARAAIAASARERASGWLGGVAARLQQMVSVRPARPMAGSSAGAILSRAEGALEAGDLSGATAEAATLKGAALAEITPWLARARLRLAADEAVAALNASFMTAYQN